MTFFAIFASKSEPQQQPREKSGASAGTLDVSKEEKWEQIEQIDLSFLPIPDYTPGTDEEKRLVRKIDLYLLPTIFMMYLLSYLDRTNIGNAKTAGMEVDLDLSSTQYSTVLVVMIVFYVSMEIPTNMILSKSRPSIFLPAIMILWGTVTASMSQVKTYHQMVACRALVGIFEAGFAPGVLLMFSSWYRRSEQAMRFGIYISAPVLSGAFGGLFAGAITGHLDGVRGMAGWRWLFLIEGVGTVGIAFMAFFTLLDFPSKSRYMSDRERDLALTRLKYESLLNSNTDHTDMTHSKALKKALINWRTWLFTLGYAIINTTSSQSYFYPTLVKSLGYSGTKIQYMTVPIYAVAFVFNISTSYFGDRHIQNHRGHFISCCMVIVCLTGILTTTVYNNTARYIFLIFMCAAVWCATSSCLAFASSSFGYLEREARGISLATMNGLGTASTIAGSFLFPAKDSPKYIMGFSVVSATSFLGIAIFLLLAFLIKRYPGN
ncbi:major facilitator superfamily domain-containing protein [Lipomyces japonicus]|uniref:major facilitator superfamily domain-containing protein n=1 Tax=Lipomyces japonicus TaxID=56871 RepID=UPI0034CEB089